MCEALSAIRTPTVAVSTPRLFVAEASAYVCAVVTGLSPGGASRRRPKNSGRQKRPYVRYAPFMGAPAPHCQFGDSYFLSETFKRPLRYFGASTMVIWRPSINGSDSTLAIGPVSTFTRCKSL